MKIAIIAVGYNRPYSMQNLLNSIGKANYCGDKVDLIVSIDKGACQSEVVKVAEVLDWKFGNKYVRAYKERQGLRSHILQCGAISKQYDAIVVLEDDIVVSEGYYSYCKQMIEFYGENNKIAGISLYKHKLNTGVNRPFDAAEGKADVFFMQIAQSWGQCWTTRMWNEFEKWYGDNSGEIIPDATYPEYMAKWERSWLKYNTKYLVENNKYFVYPYKSLSTDHTDPGEHASIINNDYQVPMLEGTMQYRCCSLEDGVKYDVFYERVGIGDKLLPELKGKKLLDLMGGRKQFGDADFLISVQSLPYHVVKEFRLCYRPVEFNLMYPLEGKGIYVYDLHRKSYPPKNIKTLLLKYDLRCITWRRALKYSINEILAAVCRKIGQK